MIYRIRNDASDFDKKCCFAFLNLPLLLCRSQLKPEAGQNIFYPS